MSDPVINRINRRHCCVPECESISGGATSLHRFPLRDRNLYEKWLRVLKITKPSREMYVCSTHFNESDFFGGWLAVEPSKRRLKRGVIPSLKLPKSKVDKRNTEKKQTLLNNTGDFAASLKLNSLKRNPATKISDNDNQRFDDVINTKTVEEEHDTKTEITNKRKAENFEESEKTDTENLLILKRVAEIKEAPESQAKKKHEAQLSILKARQKIKDQMKQVSPKLPDSNVSPVIPKFQVRKIEELTQPKIEKNLIQPSSAMRQLQSRTPQQMRKIRVLTQAEVEKIRKQSKSQFRKIRVVSQSQLNKLQDSQLKILERKSEYTKSQIEAQDLTFEIQKNISLPQANTMQVHQHKIQQLLEAECLPTNSKKYQKFENFMNNTIAYFDRISEELDKKKVLLDDLGDHKISSTSTLDNTVNAVFDVNQQKGTPTGCLEIPPSMVNSVEYLENIINDISNEISVKDEVISSKLESKYTQTEDNEITSKSGQTENSSLKQPMYFEFVKTKQENLQLKDQVVSLKNKIAVLEKELLKTGKTQLLYVIKS